MVASYLDKQPMASLPNHKYMDTAIEKVVKQQEKAQPSLAKTNGA